MKCAAAMRGADTRLISADIFADKMQRSFPKAFSQVVLPRWDCMEGMCGVDAWMRCVDAMRGSNARRRYTADKRGYIRG